MNVFLCLDIEVVQCISQHQAHFTIVMFHYQFLDANSVSPARQILFPDLNYFISFYCEYPNFIPPPSSISWRDLQGVLQDGVNGVTIRTGVNRTDLNVLFSGINSNFRRRRYTCLQNDSVGILSRDFDLDCK